MLATGKCSNGICKVNCIRDAFNCLRLCKGLMHISARKNTATFCCLTAYPEETQAGTTTFMHHAHCRLVKCTFSGALPSSDETTLLSRCTSADQKALPCAFQHIMTPCFCRPHKLARPQNVPALQHVDKAAKTFQHNSAIGTCLCSFQHVVSRASTACLLL